MKVSDLEDEVAERLIVIEKYRNIELQYFPMRYFSK